MIVIAFYTGKAYAKEARLLKRSLDALNMDSRIMQVLEFPDWHHAVSYKPIFIYEMRETFSGPLVCVDVDAFFHSDPSAYFDGLFTDFGAHWFQGPSGGYDRTRNDNWMLSGTTFWGDTKGARRLLQTWIQKNKNMQAKGCWEGGGQANLRDIVESKTVQRLRITKLPGQYCYVFDKPWAYPPGTIPVIEHTIASRENKDASKGKINAPRQSRIRQLRRKLERGT